MPKCSECPQTKASEFNKKGKGFQSKCRPCQHEWFRNYYTGDARDRHIGKVNKRNQRIHDANRELVDSMKRGPCADCGKPFKPWQMDFDHVRGKKLFSVSHCARKTKEQILKEIEKCELVCANCHRDRTYQRSHDSR